MKRNRIVMLLSLLTATFAGMAQETVGSSDVGSTSDEVNFHVYVMQEDPIYMGQEFRVYYRSDHEMDNIKRPEIDRDVFTVKEEGTIFHSNEKYSEPDSSANTLWSGIYYVLSAKRPGIFPLPSTTATLNGKTYTAETDTLLVYSLTDYFIDCETTIEPIDPVVGEPFVVKMTLSKRWDKTPTVNFGRLTLLEKRPSLSAYIVDEDGIYTYTWQVVAPRVGHYRIPPFNIEIGKKPYKTRGTSFDVRQKVMEQKKGKATPSKSGKNTGKNSGKNASSTKGKKQ